MSCGVPYISTLHSFWTLIFSIISSDMMEALDRATYTNEVNTNGFEKHSSHTMFSDSLSLLSIFSKSSPSLRTSVTLISPNLISSPPVVTHSSKKLLSTTVGRAACSEFVFRETDSMLEREFVLPVVASRDEPTFGSEGELLERMGSSSEFV